MNNVNKNIKLSHRLEQIKAMINPPYQHIWDCCCDHGLLGLSLLAENAANTVHFVDVVPELLNNIERTLLQFWQGRRDNWQVHCVDASKLPIEAYSPNKQDKHLIIIAGVGGELIVQLLTSLHYLTEQYQIEFILCPVHHNYKVREYLIAQQFGLIDECLLFENKRGYEVLHVAAGVKQSLAVTGSKMWDFTNTTHIDYLDKTIAHYQRLANNPNNAVSHIIRQYQALK